jgi:predicted NAD-dependent protein-ADP-ribosyltransferase YbiA (DUF1768 family)
MIWIKFDSKNATLIEKWLKSLSSYTLSWTMSSTTIRLDSGEKIIFSKIPLGIGMLGLISRVKKLAHAWAANNPHLLIEKPPVHCFAARSVIYNGQIFEYDKNAAYVNTAKQLGILDDKTYKRLMGIHKPLRLVALGALAIHKVEERWENGKRITSQVKYDPVTTKVWNTIVTKTDERMREIFNRYPEIIFYWYDAAFSSAPIPLDKKEFKMQRTRGHIDTQQHFIAHFSDGRIFYLPKVTFTDVP